MIYGDGYQGYLDESPYDGIIVTAGAKEVPKNLLSQLKLNGKMVIPLGDEVQKMLLYTKKYQMKIMISKILEIFNLYRC